MEPQIIRALANKIATGMTTVKDAESFRRIVEADNRRLAEMHEQIAHLNQLLDDASDRIAELEGKRMEPSL